MLFRSSSSAALKFLADIATDGKCPVNEPCGALNSLSIQVDDEHFNRGCTYSLPTYIWQH